jgi:hypothetical protein
MLNRIRLAKKEEIESIFPNSDLIPGSTVLALDTPEGVAFAVIRTVVEVDPVIYPEKMSNRLKTVFQRDIETVLAAQGVPQYYFNIHTTNDAWLETAKHYGAVVQSTAPELRFKKTL